MLRIFSNLRDKSAFYICVISRNKLTGLGKGYSTMHVFLFGEIELYKKRMASLKKVMLDIIHSITTHCAQLAEWRPDTCALDICAWTLVRRTFARWTFARRTFARVDILFCL